ncbi:DUF2130 domain-containing protein [Aquiluna sp. KACHI24]|uniref:DUF2130 domain-containing protein n=1 Tax=Aquiluna sp. KACHI24 TaxID=2968831 RepID=UPI0022038BFE|nr:DUF2130 domain-containing protein [Aquiluna sp. KACHI24]BDQ00954.1 hypothetical protein AKACHI_12900 [Aquiluna sp. KACHI24]
MTNEIKCPHCGEAFTIDEAGYVDILNQVRTAEFEKELHDRLKEADQLKKSEIALAEAKIEQKLRDEAAKKEAELVQLKAKLDATETEKKLAVQEATSKLERERDEMKAKLDQATLVQEVEINKVSQGKDLVISDLQARLDEAQRYKASLSTKGIGEEFENYCRTEFEKIRATAFPRAYFEKDSQVVENTKGDFVFRDYDENGVEIISIMFEMKNEAEGSKQGQKNESFYDKLDKDRKKKNCEYAVLVTTLEKESELFNSGIVDVSHKHEKMYVIRPQFFISMITTLRNAALRNVRLKAELEAVRAQNVDVTNFEKHLTDFQAYVEGKHKDATKHYEEVIKNIDKTIGDLEKMKENFRLFVRDLQLIDKKAQEVTVSKLTKGNPTMQQKFKELEK